MSYQLETTALISKDNYNAFRIRCIMLILERFKNKEIRNHLFHNFTILWGIGYEAIIIRKSM
jgi:hypothetical protein